MITRILFILFILSGITHAQPEVDWDHLYGQRNDYGQLRNYCWAMTPTTEGGYALVGRLQIYDGEHAQRPQPFILVTDSSGELLWSKVYDDSSGYREAGGVIQTMDGGFLISGLRGGYGLALKTDEEGNEEWNRVYEDEGVGLFRGIVAAGDGSYILSGQKNVNGLDCWLMKIDEDGEVIWSETYGTNRREWGGEVIKTRDGGFALGGGSAFDDDRNHEGLLLKVNEDGEEEWLSTFGTEYNEQTLYIIQTHDGGYAAAGEIATVEMSSTSDMFLARLDSEGDIIWMDSYGGNIETGGETIYAIQQSWLDHGFILAGVVPAGNPALRIVRTDQHGEEMWTMDMQGNSSNGLTGLVELPDHSYVVAGSANRSWIEGEPDLDSFFLSKTTPDPLVDEAVELEIERIGHDFREVAVDSVAVYEFEIYNTGRRYAVIDTTWFEGSNTAAFSCPLELPLIIYPEDTCLVPVLFSPSADTSYAAVLIIPYGDRQALRVLLDGNGYVNSVSDEPNVLHEFALYEAYPNPFNSSTTISFGLDKSAPTRIALYDLSGREIVTLVNNKLEAGYYNAVWNAAEFPSGLYICRMEAGGFYQSRKLILVR